MIVRDALKLFFVDPFLILLEKYRMQATYPGDKKAEEIFKNAGSSRSLSEIKSFLAGVIMGHEFIQPMKVLEEMEFGERGELPDFSNIKIANEFMAAYFGLWNEVAVHRDPIKPFSFSSSLTTQDKLDESIWLPFAERRLNEMAEFLMGLGVSETPTLLDLADSKILVKNDEYLPNIIAKNFELLQIEVLKQTKSKKKTGEVIFSLIEDTDKAMKTHHAAFCNLLQSIEAAPKPAQRPKSKVGRNEPCPCGSGKKSKHCCLK